VVLARRRIHLLVSLVAVCAIVAAPLASAGELPSFGGRAVKKSGSCPGPSHWVLVLRSGDPGDLVVTFTVHGGASGQTWSIFMDDNGRGFFHGTRTSKADGWFRVRTVTRNRLGTDKIVVAADNAKTGELCQATASF